MATTTPNQSIGLTPQMSIVNADRTPTPFFFRWLLNSRSAAAQTPWAQDVDAAGFALDNLGALSLDGPITFPDGTVQTTAFVPGMAGIVTSVFGRTGVVTARSGDYNVTQVTGAAAQAIVIGAGAGLTGGGDLTANRTLALVPATASALGGVKIGSGITVASDGTISAAGGGNQLQSIFAYGAVGDGVTDDSAAFVAATAAGGARLPAGYTYLVNSSLALPAGVAFVGGGPTSIVKRGAALASGHALFDINGSNVLLSNFTIDGGVTVSQGVNYSTLAAAASPYDPMQDVLSLNSSIWIHGNFNNGQISHIILDSLTIQHTGGYAVLLDARNGDICNVQILSPTLINNRPHLFGTNNADLTYGSWTGGIHWQGNCDSGHPFTVKGLLVQGGTFRRNTGNCIWGHSYAFNFLHQNIRVAGNYFEDSGLDCILIAAASTVAVTGNTGRRVGYVCSDDTSASTPKYLGGLNATFLDTSGCASADYTGNAAVSVYGGFIDLDGFSYGNVSGNVGRAPVPGDAEYTEDQIAAWMSPNPCYGAQTGNNYFLDGGRNVTIVGNTFINMAQGAVRLFAARGCHVAANNINHPAGASQPPVLIGNMQPASTPATTYYSQNNSIAENNIQWAPATAKAAIQEQENWGAGALPWTGQANWVASNRLTGANAFEFSRAPSSTSTTATRIPSEASGLSAGAAVAIRRERIAGADATSMYGPTGTLQWRFTDAGGLTFPDGTVQPTAATGGSGGQPQTPWLSDINSNGFALTAVGGNALTFKTNAKTRMSIDSAGSATLNANDGGTVTLNLGSTGNTKITRGSSGYTGIFGTDAGVSVIGGPNGIGFYTSPTVGATGPSRIGIDSAGHVTIAPPDDAPAQAFYVNGAARVGGSLEGDAAFAVNLYYNGSVWIYRMNAAGALFNSTSVQAAAAGTAGAAATLNTLLSFPGGVMTLANSAFVASLSIAGNSVIEGNMPNSSIVFCAGSSTQLVFRVRCSDGVMRQAALTLS